MPPRPPGLLLAGLLAGATLSSTATARAEGPGPAILPLAEVRPGMEGEGRTVFEGATITSFRVRILGVLENAVGPRHSLVLARLSGGPLAETGVIAGMSGSPVFVDGRLLGAIAYAFPFGKEPIAGITPIAEMIASSNPAAPRAASARLRLPSQTAALAAPLDRDAVAAAFARPQPALVAGAFRGEALPQGLAGATLHPLALPLVFSGFEPDTFAWARGVFASMGFAPVMGGGAAGSSPGPVPDIAPGAAIGVSLVEGDLDLSVSGTVTHIDQGRVYALGHPFYNLGPTQFPLRKAWVHAVFPSLQVSWKIASALDAIGTLDQDRTTAVSGRLGPLPRMMGVVVRLRSSRASERVFRFRVAQDELLTPLVTYVSLLSVLQGHERAFGAATLRVEARLALAGGREVRFEDVVASEQPAQAAAAVVAGPLAVLAANDFERVAVDELELTVDAVEGRETATLVRAWLDAPLPLRPGSVVPLRVQLRTRRGETLTETLSLEVPASATGGSYTLLIADASTMDQIEQREMRQAFAPRDLDALVRALNKLRPGNRVYARLTRPAGGAVVGGEYLPALPSSVLSVLSSADQGTSVVPLPSAPVWQGEIRAPRAVTGWRQLSVPVER
jgi:SpoIVB peptidase S55